MIYSNESQINDNYHIHGRRYIQCTNMFNSLFKGARKKITFLAGHSAKRGGGDLRQLRNAFFLYFFFHYPITMLFWYISKRVFSSFPVSAAHQFFQGTFFKVFFLAIFRVGVCWFQTAK